MQKKREEVHRTCRRERQQCMRSYENRSSFLKTVGKTRIHAAGELFQAASCAPTRRLCSSLDRERKSGPDGGLQKSLLGSESRRKLFWSKMVFAAPDPPASHRQLWGAGPFCLSHRTSAMENFFSSVFRASADQSFSLRLRSRRFADFSH